jgi:hypothetical protein
MKKNIAFLVALFVLTFAVNVKAADHSSHGAERKTATVHEEVVEGVKATFNVQTMSDAMKAMGMDMPREVKETHHISVSFKDTKTGKALTEGTVAIKIQNPDKTSQSKDLNGMHGHFGADFNFSRSGKYGIMCKFVTRDGKIRQAKFWYPVK